MKTRFLLLAAVTVFLTGFVSVGQAGQSFISINGGYSLLSDSDVEFDAFSGDEYEIEHEGGMMAYSVSIGGLLSKNWRAETEFLYQRNNFDKVSLSGASTDSRGDTTMKAAMGNVYYDFNNSTIITPFLTGGIGVAQVASDYDYPVKVENDDVVFASQVGAGVACQILDWLFLDLKYRFFVTSPPNYKTAEAD
ncbi:MAG: outer membrane protein, partial [Desulfosudaceae bacterium]